MDIKPIETHYNGYRFRSRLEARWAVFFDAAGIKYEYEPEGYELNDGTRYLPDFWLPEYRIFLEIKPKLDRYDPKMRMEYDKQEKLCSDFRNEIGKAILLYRGTPWEDYPGLLFAFDLCDSGGGASVFYARFSDISLESDSQLHPVIMVGDTRLDREICIDNSFTICRNVINANMALSYYPRYSAYAVLGKMDNHFNPNGDDMFNAAKQTAKQSRFEFGEMPKARW